MQKLLFAFLLALLHLHVQASGIQFTEGNFQAALDQAAKENKLVFMDVFTDWCKPCKWMAATTFQDPAVAAFFNEHFVNFGLDAEKGEGVALAKRYDISSFPTLLFLRPDGEPVEIMCRTMRQEELLPLAQRVQQGRYSDFVPLWKRYMAGERSHEFLNTYLVALHRVNGNPKKILPDYRATYMQGPLLLQPAEWALFKLYITEIDAPEFRYVEAHLADFAAAFTRDSVIKKIAWDYSMAAALAAYDADTAAVMACIARMEAYPDRPFRLAIAETELIMLEAGHDVEAYLRKAEEVFQVVDRENLPWTQNNAAWWVHEHAADATSKHLKQALEWVNAAIQVAPFYGIYDTKAMLLHDLGRDKAARQAAETAIAKATASGEDFSSTEAALKSWE